MKTVFDNLSPERSSLLSRVRTSLKTIDPSVIEQVRMHRIVFSRGFAMRDFVEIVVKHGKLCLVSLSPRMIGSEVVISDEKDIDAALDLALKSYEAV
ncbi:MAG: hypothetical protein QW767_02875 [Thermoprotei archaeon]